MGSDESSCAQVQTHCCEVINSTKHTKTDDAATKLVGLCNITHIMRRYISLLLSILLATTQLMAQTPAFPGAEGHARYTTTGGRGGKVYHVTKLTDDGSKGTLRYAVRKSGVRTVVFDVSGTIELESDLVISSGDITIAGQTAPGDGICLKNYSLKIDADNVIIRFIRCRLGETATDARDAFEGQRHSNIIIDHCSMSFSTDECASFYDNTNFTMQWCFIAESLKASTHVKGNHGYGGIWGGKNASFHHNILAHHDSRNPRMCGSRYSNRADLENVDFRNNVIYNWGNTNSGYAGEGGTYNFVNNYYKPGPATKSSIVARIFQPNADDGTNSQLKGVWGTFYVAGNYVDGTAPFDNVQNNLEKINATNADNWNGIHPNTKNAPLPEEGIQSSVEYDAGDVTTHTAAVAYEKVVAYAGASLSRDAQDERIAGEIIAGSYTYAGSSTGLCGIIDKTSDVGGWSELLSSEPAADSDEDGIPDEWEELNGLDANNADDAVNEWYDGTGYTALEVYLHSLVDHIVRDGQSDGSNINELYPRYVSASINHVAKEQVRVTYSCGRYTIDGYIGRATLYVYDLSGVLQATYQGVDNINFDLNTPSIVRLVTSDGVYVRKLMTR